jgi:hypothetical protein
MKKPIECRRQRSRAGRYDFLVTGFSRRAVHVFCDRDYDLTEHEWYWTLQAVAEKAAQLGWKHVKFYGVLSGHVSIKNPAGHEIYLGDFSKIADPDSFLNDNYYTPKGFWIKNPQ